MCKRSTPIYRRAAHSSHNAEFSSRDKHGPPSHENAPLNVKVIFWNMYSFNNIFDCDRFFNYSDILCFSETWLTHDSPVLPYFFSNHDAIFSAAKKSHQIGRASGGLLILINRDLYTYELLFKSENWIFLQITTKTNFSFILGSIYFQPNCDLEEKLGNLKSHLVSMHNFRNNDTLFIIGGDFNARVGNLNQLPPEFFHNTNSFYPDRHTSDDTTNSRGRDLTAFFESIDFCLLNGRASGDTPAGLTYHGSRTASQNPNSGKRCGSSIVDLA